MSEVFPYTGKDIAKATGGYVNSGVLRMWVSEGRLTAGGRANSRGGPRTFSRPIVTKAVVMAELRKCGVALDQAEKTADEHLAIFKKISDLSAASDEEGLDAAIFDLPLFYAIEHETGAVTPITGHIGIGLFRDVMETFGPSVSIINTMKIISAVDGVLEVMQPFLDQRTGTTNDE